MYKQMSILPKMFRPFEVPNKLHTQLDWYDWMENLEIEIGIFIKMDDDKNQ